MDPSKKEVSKFIAIFRRCHGETGNHLKVGQIEHAMVGWTIGSYNTCPVQDKYHREILNGDIVDDHIKASLQERGVDGHDRFHSRCGQASGEGDGMFFGYSRIEEPIRILLCKINQARAFTHGRNNATDILVFLRQLTRNLSEYTAVTGCRILLFLTISPARQTVVLKRISLCLVISDSLPGEDMNHRRTWKVSQILERFNHLVQIVTIDGTKVSNTQLFEDHARNQKTLQAFLKTVQQSPDSSRTFRQLSGQFPYPVTNLIKKRISDNLG